MSERWGAGARFLVVALGCAWMMGGCGDDGGGGGEVTSETAGGGAATCTTTASIEVSQGPGLKTLSATGTIECVGGTAELALEVCAQLDGSDVICATRSQSGVTELSERAQTSCIGQKVFRARVVGAVDGVVREVFSDEQTVQCM